MNKKRSSLPEAQRRAKAFLCILMRLGSEKNITKAHGEEIIAAALAAAHYDPHYASIHIEQHEGWTTPIAIAIQSGDDISVERLLAAGAESIAMNKGGTIDGDIHAAHLAYGIGSLVKTELVLRCLAYAPGTADEMIHGCSRVPEGVPMPFVQAVAMRALRGGEKSLLLLLENTAMRSRQLHPVMSVLPTDQLLACRAYEHAARAIMRDQRGLAAWCSLIAVASGGRAPEGAFHQPWAQRAAAYMVKCDHPQAHRMIAALGL